MCPLKQAPGIGRRVFAAGLGAILCLHLLVLATTHGPMNTSAASLVLQALSLILATFFSGLAALRSRNFARNFWALTSVGFAMLLTGFILWQIQREDPFGINDFFFLLHMVPFGLALLLYDRPRMGRATNWPVILDYLQISLMVGILFTGFIYRPSHGATPEQMQALFRSFAAVLVTRNIVVTGGFWARALLAGSRRESTAFRAMGIYLLIYTAGSALGHYVFLSVHPSPAWLDLQGSVPALTAAWFSSQWKDLPAEHERQRTGFRSVLATHLIPSILPLLVAALAALLGKRDPGLAWFAVTVSFAIFAARLLVTIYSEHRAGEAKSQAESRYQSLFENNLAGVFRSSLDGHLLDCNKAFAQMLGYSREELFAMPTYALYPGGKAERDARIGELQKSGHFSNYETCFRRKDGSFLWALQNVDLGEDEHGNKVSEGTIVDITARKLAETEIAEWKKRYEAAVLASGQILFDWHPVSRLVTFGGALKEVLGYSPEEFAGTTEKWRGLIHPDDLSRYLSIMNRAMENKKSYELEYRVQRKDGEYRMMHEQGHAVLEESGNVAQMVGFLTDVSERHMLEQQFRQAQKMEAVGRLAGGVAHDFNNLLTVITGYSELLLNSASGGGNPYREQAEQIRAAADRAAALTRQLLAFSRQQVMQPQNLNLNTIVSNFDKMLRRLIGEDIEVRTVLAEDLGSAEVDPGQIEQVLMNLVVNARDAMPKGGRLTIETANAHLDDEYKVRHRYVVPGHYVQLTVSDTGVGMSAETRARLFEPFFTTKEVGKGTGLGLSTVYGIVKQSGGYIEVYSEPGLGSSFKIYFPQVKRSAEGVARKLQAAPDHCGTETILLAEDDEQLRELASLVLTARGYRVLSAGSSEEVEAICKGERERIHLLLTDVVMPRMSGTEIARRVAERRPGIRVLYMSGYTEDATVHHGVLENGVAFLQKPFTPATLAAKVREVLDQPARN